MNLHGAVAVAAVLLATLAPAAVEAQPATEATRQIETLIASGRNAEALAAVEVLAAREGWSAALHWAAAHTALLLGDVERARREAAYCLESTSTENTRAAACRLIRERAEARPLPQWENPAARAEAPQAPAETARRPEIVAPPVREAHAEVTPTRSRPWVGPVVLWSLAGASLATAGALALVRGEVLAPCTVTDDVAWCPDVAARDRAAQAPGLTLGANMLLGVGLAAAASGAVWWLLGRPSSSPAVQVDHTGVRLGWQGRF